MHIKKVFVELKRRKKVENLVVFVEIKRKNQHCLQFSIRYQENKLIFTVLTPKSIYFRHLYEISDRWIYHTTILTFPSTAFGHSDRKKRSLIGRHNFVMTPFIRLSSNFYP
jgi:hypothetical protein